jgi:hypothetical protein
MDSQRRQTLWTIALENYQAAVFTAQRGWYNVSVACSYYAVFTAMWVALGDPPGHRWEHGGIVERFAPGQWRTPPAPIERELTRGIRRLYADRLAAIYRAVQLSSLESTASMTTARRVLRLVSDAYGLPQGGIIL